MALARLSAIFVLVLHLQNSRGQQRALGNLPTLGLNNLSSSQQALQRKAGLISNPKNYNQIAKSGNIGSSFNIQQQNDNLNLQSQNNNLNLQQQNINLQQQNLNLQQSGLLQPINLQQPQNYQPTLNLQQSNVQQAQNMQQPLNINIQQPLLNQNMQQSLNLQQQISQQQQCAVPATNLQIVGQQTPIQTSGNSFASLPVVNGQLSGLPSQISQGVLLPNLGLSSSLSSFLPNTYGSKQVDDQISVIFPQNNAVSFSNIPISVVDRSQTANALPVSISSSFLPADYSTFTSNPSSLNSMMLPITLRTGSTCPQNQQNVDLVQNSLANVQNQPIQSQISFRTVPQPVTQTHNQQVATSAQTQSSPIASLLLSQLQSPNATPQYPMRSGYAGSSILNPQTKNHGSKSSNIKALLPFLLNLIKEKNGCGCPPCNNCGCINNNNGNNHKQCNNVQEPQIFTGYSKQINYGDAYKDDSVNNVSSEEYDSSVKLRDRPKYQRYESRQNKSGDYYEGDDEQIEDSYDDED